MKRVPCSQRVVADISFSARAPGRDDHRDVVQWQMPATRMRLFQAEARRQGRAPTATPASAMSAPPFPSAPRLSDAACTSWTVTMGKRCHEPD